MSLEASDPLQEGAQVHVRIFEPCVRWTTEKRRAESGNEGRKRGYAVVKERGRGMGQEGKTCPSIIRGCEQDLIKRD